MSQVGQTSLAVVPNMRGFRSKVNAESKASARQAGRSMRDVMRKSGDDAGRQWGRGMRSSATEVQRLVKDTTRANAQAVQGWTRANRANEDQLGRVRVAQAKLANAVERYGEDSVQAVTAQERLAAAQRKAQETSTRLQVAQERLTEATKAMKAAQDAAAGSAGGSVWARMARDLAPVSSMVSQVVGRVREWANTNPAIQRFRGSMRDMGTDVAKAALATYNFGDGIRKRFTGAVTNAGQRLSGAFNGFLSQRPALNAAFTGITDRVRSVSTAVSNTLPVFGALGSAAVTGARGIGQALGPGLAAAWSGLKNQISSAAEAFKSVLGGAAVTTGALIAGAIGKALTGGFSRLSRIENAEAKMRGLGFAADDIEQAMAGAGDAVDGTAFALDEMASAASVAMAAGLKPGKELNGYMATLKNSAAASGASLAEMGSILNKTLTSGRAQTMEINQIADRGLPIWTKLQEQYGVTADELRKMVSAGEVDAETFMQVMNDMTGSVADEMGGTTTAAIANFGTALSKLGADMLQGLYPVLGPLFNAMKSGLQMLQTFGAPVFESFGASFAPLAERLTAFNDKWLEVRDSISEGMEPFDALAKHMPKVAEVFEGVGGAFEKFKKAFDDLGSGVAPVIGGLVGALGPLLARIPLIGGAFSGVTGPVGIFIGVLVAMWQQSETLRDAVGEVFTTLFDAVMSVLPQLTPIFGMLGDAINLVAQTLGDVLGAALQAIVPLIEPLMGIVATLIEALVPFIPIVAEIAALIGEALVMGISALEPLIALVAEAFTMIQPIIVMVAGVVMELVQAFIPLIESLSEIIGAVLPPLIDLFMAVLPPIMELVATIISALMPVIQGLIDIFGGLIDFIVGVFTGNWDRAWQGVSRMFTGFVDTIKGLVKGLGKIIGGIYDTVIDVFKGVGTWLVDVGKSLIQGFIDGVMSMFGAVGDAFGGLMDWVGGFFPSSPAKRGPLSGAGWRRLKNSGRAYMDQWTDGVQAEARNFDLEGMVQHVRGVAPYGAVVSARGGGAGGGQDAGPAVFNLYDENGTLMATFKGLLSEVLGVFSSGESVSRRGVAPGR